MRIRTARGGRGAGTLILEEYDGPETRRPIGEIEGFWSNGSGMHLTNSDARSMEECLLAALKDAGRNPEEIQHVNAHATATSHGDEIEAIVTNKIYGAKVPVTSLKGHMGHTMGACGRSSHRYPPHDAAGFIASTLNLETPDPALPPLKHIMGEPLDQSFRLGVSNTLPSAGSILHWSVHLKVGLNCGDRR
jgi:3-oxoacyl-[acyl-carrier-protein] synthase II